MTGKGGRKKKGMPSCVGKRECQRACECARAPVYVRGHEHAKDPLRLPLVRVRACARQTGLVDANAFSPRIPRT